MPEVRSLMDDVRNMRSGMKESLCIEEYTTNRKGTSCF